MKTLNLKSYFSGQESSEAVHGGHVSWDQGEDRTVPEVVS